MPWLTSPKAHGSSLARESSPVAARTSIGACPRLPPATRAVSRSQIQPSDAPPGMPTGSHRPTSHSSSVSACRPSRLTSATITLMCRSPPPTTLPASPRPAATISAIMAMSTHGAHCRARASSARRPMRSPSWRARSVIREGPSGECAAAVRRACASSSGPSCSAHRTASVITASGKALGCDAVDAVSVNRGPSSVKPRALPGARKLCPARRVQP
jgi:hypothetical protein